MNLHDPAVFFLALVCGAGLSFAQIGGTVTVDGVAPVPVEIQGMDLVGCRGPNPVYDPTWTVGKAGELANVVVYLESTQPDRLKGGVRSTPAQIANKNCLFVPHVVAVRVGEELKVTNSDQHRHGFHSRSVENAVVNFMLMKNGTKTVKFDAVEAFKVVCDAHAWETAWICCLPNSFFAVTGADGKFAIDPPPPDGQYTVIAWHETGQTQKVLATVVNGKATVNLAIKPPEAHAPEAPNRCETKR